MSERPAGGAPANDVYTVLVMLAAILMAGATVYLTVRSHQLFGSWHPFSGV